ncbi:hypothetical protein KTE13_28905 [Burkholderia multivorans]|uniref:hypothetical protein n=1 Tax=Burkholderia multivorans TaxID=87883 RepID=UPI001C2119FB|nr:hypothetical protein [Burkholderia multivorans]MBU9403770.1 hypothetical protein [Burkholderia multivorans]
MDRLDELLLDWYEWQNGYVPKLGHRGADPACRDFRISRQWMDYDDLDAEVERNRKAYVGRLVEPMIQKLDMRLRLAINTAMRNFSAGATVWINPRHPDTQDQDYACAKTILCSQMVAAGLLERGACKPLENAL